MINKQEAEYQTALMMQPIMDKYVAGDVSDEQMRFYCDGFAAAASDSGYRWCHWKLLLHDLRKPSFFLTLSDYRRHLMKAIDGE